MAVRDIRLDSLRGIFLVLMTIDHIGGKLTLYAYEPFGFVSAAAAFVMLSAYMYAFTTRSTPPSRQALTQQSWKRIAKLYRYHIGVLTLLVLLTVVSPVHRDYLANQLYPAATTPMTAMLYGGVLLHQPKLLHLLPMYMLLSLLSPAMLMAFRRGWTLAVFLVSVAFWVWGQFFDPLEWLAAASGTGARAGNFNLFAWQLLWVSGLYIGYVHGVERRKVFFASPLWLGAALMGAVVFLLVRQGIVPMPDALNFYIEKSDMRALRLVNIFSQVVIFCALLPLVPIHKGLPWFRFLGRYALPVFSFHVLVVAFLEPVSWRISINHGYAVEVAYLAAAAASLSIPALLYRAYEAKLRASSARSWPARFSAVGAVARGMLKGASKPEAMHPK